MLKKISIKKCVVSLFASAFLAFGLYNVHSFAGITEGGVLGMTLLLQHLLKISPAISGAVMNVICYALGWKTLGREFIFYSAVSSAGFSLSYSIYEQFPPLFPFFAEMPFLASVIGAVFVGVGAGLCVRMGGATGGDDALAMSLSKLLKAKIETIYLISDLVVLGLSVCYIPFKKLAFSLFTVILSGQIIGFVQRVKLPLEGKKD